MKKQLLVLSLWLLPLFMWGQAPAGYYSNADGKSGAALKTALFNIIKTHTSVSYDGLYTVYPTSDNLSGNKVWDMYSIKADGTADYFYTQGQQKCGTYQKEGDCYNREHSMPQSWFNSASPMVSDAFHVYPTDGKVNGMRSNYPYGEVITASYTSSNGSKLGDSDPSTGYTGIVFEPIDEFKGDFARTYFYMATCYEDKIASWVGNGSAGTILDGTSYPAFKTWYVQLLLKWSRQDPVSQKEIDRNNAVYAIQHNRNPYIDHPEYAEYVWGGETPSGVQVSNVALLPAHPNETNAVSVSATVSGTKPISLVQLKWGTTSSITNEISMTSTDGINYTTTAAIPAQSVGSTIYYAVYAEDNEGGNKLTQTQTYTVENSIAPTNLLSADFSSCLPVGWVTYSVASNKDWICYSNQYMEVNGYNGDVASEDWLVTSKVDATNYHDVALTFNVKTKYTDTNYPNTLTVYYSTNYTGTGNPNAATWNLLSYAVPAANSNAFASSGSINLAAVDGKQFYIGFKYVSTGVGSNSSALWDVDDVVVTATPGSNPTNQVPSVNNIVVAPASPVAGENVTFSATATDSDGSISTVKVMYGTSESALNQNAAMTLLSGSSYSATISTPTGSQLFYQIVATDNLGAATSSQVLSTSITTPPNQLPSISNINFAPQQPQVNDELTITAIIIDSDGSIVSALAYYGTSENDLQNQQAMQVQSGNAYETTIRVPQGAALYFKLSATDNQGGNSYTSPVLVTISTGIGSSKTQQIEVYPNPAHQNLAIASSSSSPMNIAIYDLIGKKIVEKQNVMPHENIDISAITSGIYLVRITTSSGVVTKKITVTK